MDIAVLLEKEEYEYFFTHPKSENIDGFNMHACLKKLYWAREGERVYFKLDNRIVGYAVVYDYQPVDDLRVTEIPKLWQLKDYILIRWNSMFWYDRPVEYKKEIKLFGVRYINFKKVLRGKPEPKIIKQKGGVFG